MLKLHLEQIQDIYSRENFKQIEEAFNDLVFTLGDFQFFEHQIKGAHEDYKLYHHLGFKPNDIIVTKAIGSNFQFDYEGFNNKYLTVKTSGDVYLRMFIGNMRGNEVAGPAAFPGITDDLGSTGGSGGGSINFHIKDVAVDAPLVSARKILLNHIPMTNSTQIMINGLDCLDVDDWSFDNETKEITLEASALYAVGDDIRIRYAA